MNSHLHHTVVAARLADFRRVADEERRSQRARPAPRARRASLTAVIRRRVLHPVA